MKKIISFLMALALLTTLFVGCSEKEDELVVASGTTDEPVEIRFSWWGSEIRNEATLDAIALYEKENPDVKIIPEYSGYSGYQEKLMAQIAAKNAPDIITCVTEWYPALYEVDGMLDITGKFDMSGHSDAIIEACSYDGKVYGVNVSLNGYGLMYNKTLADELGIEIPEGDYTWDELVALWAEVYEKSEGEVYGSIDARMNGWVMEAYGYTVLSKEWPYIYSNDELTIEAEDVTHFLNFFGNLPEGSMLPPDESFIGENFVSPVAQRLTMFDLVSTGSFSPFQSNTEDELDLIPLPVGANGETANTARPGLIQSIYSGSKVADEAAKFLDWFSNSPDAAKILRTTRGVLPTAAQREAVLSTEGLLDRNDMVVIDCIDKIYAGETLVFLPGPLGGDQIREDVFSNICQKVAFGELTPEEAGPKYMEEAQKALDR